jgi:nucleoside-diphosphate-sugar epimerase
MRNVTRRLAMQAAIIVTGGTGTLGRHVGAPARRRAPRPRAQPPGPRGRRRDQFLSADLATGEVIEAALDGSEIIVHCAGSSKGDEDMARHLVKVASRVGVQARTTFALQPAATPGL